MQMHIKIVHAQNRCWFQRCCLGAYVGAAARARDKPSAGVPDSKMTDSDGATPPARTARPGGIADAATAPSCMSRWHTIVALAGATLAAHSTREHQRATAAKRTVVPPLAAAQRQRAT